MKLFKLSVIALLLCLSVIIPVTVCAGATTRILLFNFGILDDDMPNPSSISGYKAYQKLKNHYEDILVEAFTKTNIFDAVQYSDKEYQALMTKAMKEASTSATTGKNSEYRPTYSRSMSGTSNNYGMRMTDEEVERQREILQRPIIKLATQNNCSYVLYATIKFDYSLKIATAVLVLSDKMETMPSVHASGESKISSRNVVNEGKKTSTKSKSKIKSSSKTKKGTSSSAEEAAKDKAALEAFTAAIYNLQDALSGNVTKIIQIADNNVIINKGASSNARVGNAYLVNTEAYDGMDDIFGEDTGKSKIVNIAIIKIKEVQENSSIAEVIPDGGNIRAIRVEDTLSSITNSSIESYLQDISDGKIPPFPTQHPEVKKAEVKPATSTPTVATKTKSEKTQTVAEPIEALPPGMIRVGVMNFDSKADGISAEEASSLTDLLSRMLSNSDKVVVLERNRLATIAREQKLNIAGILDPATAAQLGKLASCQYILLGSVTGRDVRDTISGQYIRPTERADFIRYYRPGMSGTGAGVLLGLQVLSMIVEANNEQKENVVTETHEVITDVDVRLVDVQSSRILMSFREQGSAAQSDVVTQDGNGNIKGVDANYGSLENRAIASTAANISYKVKEFLTGEKLQISSVNGEEIIINSGSSSGVQIGDLFCIYANDQSAGDTEAIVSVKDVQESFSTAELVKSLSDSYSVTPGSRLESVLHSDFQKGIWHVKNQKRAHAAEKNKQNVSLEELTSNVGKKKRLETFSTDTKKVIKSYGLDPSREKSLIDAHSKASKASNAKKKYEAYKRLSEADVNDFLAAYNTGKYALEQSMYMEAREWASKALFTNPNYKPAKTLIEKIDNGD